MTTITPQWQQRIDDAQHETSVTIAGRELERKPYGCEVSNPRDQCRDCGVDIGQLHVPDCCVERCPACGGQIISCGCMLAEGPVQ